MGPLVAMLLGPALAADAQQIPDTSFSPSVQKPQYEKGVGPRVAIDAAHLNHHTANGGYAAFAELLRIDGYQVYSSAAPFSARMLAPIDVLVVVNAMHTESENDWAPLPNHSAFTEQEVDEVERWVRSGGALLLIADHMPLAAHAASLAAEFGVRFQNGFALDKKGNGKITFRRSDNSLVPSFIADGRNPDERIDAVTTYTGQAFRLDPQIKAQPLLVLSEEHELLLPEIAFQFSAKTPRIPAAHLLQGALVYHGKGRVAVLGEAAMFTAQLTGPEKRPVGMNAPDARENVRFALNVLHWLSGALSDAEQTGE